AGVYGFGVAPRCAGVSADLAAGPNAAPHAPQKFFPRGTLAPRAGHSASSRAPHSSQTVPPARLSTPQAAHRIVDILRERAARLGDVRRWPAWSCCGSMSLRTRRLTP